MSSLLIATSSRACRSSFRAVASSSKRALSIQHRVESARTGQELDPALIELLDASGGDALKGLKQKVHHAPNAPTELHVFNGPATEVVEADSDEHFEARPERRSPAAVLGSDRPAQIELSEELENAITSLVEKSDKYQLRSDAKRLFLHPTATDSSELRWEPKTPALGSKSKEIRLAARTGLAFATIALPAQYAAIATVLRELKLKVGEDELDVRQVVDFGSKTATALWAARTELDVSHYYGLDSRAGMTAMAHTLMREAGPLSTHTYFFSSWGRNGRRLAVPKEKTVAISAFSLSDLNTDFDRRQMLREMWHTGAEYLIVIDHGTKAGFQCVGDAREYFLYKGRKVVKHAEEELAIGSGKQHPNVGTHVVAPCPHDGACPLHISLEAHSRRKAVALERKLGKKNAQASQRPPDISQQKIGPTTACHFTQRLQRPVFVRKTKHANKGHEDIAYSYVIIRRGARPSPSGIPESMLVGEVGREHTASQFEKDRMEHGGSGVAVEIDNVFHFEGRGSDSVNHFHRPEYSSSEIASLRRDSYSWPRIIYPPLKRSGHVILDACTEDGNISRLTIPKSQGKQPYYDARKADWGDIFPHEPKNGREIRRRGTGAAQPGADLEPDVPTEASPPISDEVRLLEEGEDDELFKHQLALFKSEFGIDLPKELQ